MTQVDQAEADQADENAPCQLLLYGIVGSTAYGLATDTSDVDRIGIFAAPTVQLHGLHPPSESQVRTDPDITLHEAGKFARLALKANPTVSELLWLTDYEHCCEPGAELIAIREAFLSARAVRSAYLGYAHQQLTKLINRGDGSFSADTRKRSLKHARHLMRLVEQGEQLYTTGQLTVRVADPQRVRESAEFMMANPAAGKVLLWEAEGRMTAARTPLPDRPDEERVEQWLRAVRARYYTPGGGGG